MFNFSQNFYLFSSFNAKKFLIEAYFYKTFSVYLFLLIANILFL